MSHPGLRDNEAEIIEKKGWRIKVAPSGDIVSLTDGKLELVNRKLGDNQPRVLVIGKRLLTCTSPKIFRREESKLVLQYQFSEPFEVSVEYEIELMDLNGEAVAVRQWVGINPSTRLNEGVQLLLPRNIQLPFEDRKVYLPLKNGIGRRRPILGLDNVDEYVFRLAGNYHWFIKPQMLAIPMVDEFSDKTDLRITFCADPFFTSYFSLPFQEKAGQFHCIYPARLVFRVARSAPSTRGCTAVMLTRP